MRLGRRGAELRRALALDNALALAHGNLAALFARSGFPLQAEAAARIAISLAPDQHCWLTNLGVALFTQGRHAEAEQAYRKALAVRPDYAEGHGNLLFALNYRTELTAEAIFAAGLELSQNSHIRLTELCQCTRMVRKDCREEIVSIDLEVQTSPGASDQADPPQ